MFNILGTECFNEYSKSFDELFKVEKENKSLMEFEALLIMYAHSTNTRLRKRKRYGITTFSCYCQQKTIRNLSYYNGPCEFSIKVQKIENGKLKILNSNFVHNHAMLPPDLYFQLTHEASMFHLELPIKQYLKEHQKSAKDDDDDVMILNNHGKRQRDLETEESAKATEMEPRGILEFLFKSKGLFNHETKYLLEALEDKNNQGLYKKFTNLVNDIKRKMIIAGS